MKTRIHLIAFAFFLISGNGFAAEAKKDSQEAKKNDPEPIKCYEYVWGSEKKGIPGLGLNVGQAVELCGGATDAEKVIRCFEQAWAHPDDGGLGLNAGQAVRLCKTETDRAL